MNNKNVFNEILNRYENPAYYSDDAVLIAGDSLQALKRIPDHSIALILTDPPYHSTKKKNITGDTSFKKDSEYIDWLKCYAIEWKRILKFSGSIYCFCSSSMSAHLQIMFSEYFNVLSEITWTKPNAPGYDGWKQKMKKEALRQWYPHSEKIIFMENASEGNLFKSYFGGQLTSWRKSVGMSTIKLAELTGSYGNINHGGAIANWEAGRNIPSKEQYDKIKNVLTSAGVKSIPQYNDIVRPFNVNKNVEFTDVWSYENVRPHDNKHPAEKPIDLLKAAILAATYEGDIILDCFSGSGSTGVAALSLNRRCVLMELDDKWIKYSERQLHELDF